MSDAQLVSGFNRLEKILKETEIYNKLMLYHKDGVPASSLFDEDEDLLFPLEVGHELYLKAQKVYLESKSYVEGIEKHINFIKDKINKSDKSTNLANNSKFNSSNSSSSDDEDNEKRLEVGQKRKSKPATPLSTTKTKRFKPPPQTSESDKSEREGKESSNSISNGNLTNLTSNSHSNNSSPVPKEENQPLKKESTPTPTTTTSSSSLSSTSNSTSSTNGGISNSNGTNSTSNNNNSTNNSNKPELIPNGTLVAARENKNQWILAKVNGFNAKTQKYEVIDEDEEESRKFQVATKDIIQLPTLSNLPTFTVGTKVLAMFPDTTTFYTAVVFQIVKNKNKITHYVLHFDDDQENGQTPNRRVSPQHVIQYTK